MGYTKHRIEMSDRRTVKAQRCRRKRDGLFKRHTLAEAHIAVGRNGNGRTRRVLEY
jgi:hypothetical protein